ncbi:hypothetical protein [Klebsiella oxytoca]|uniref:hypothetical protein n=1 Tax=Klebsiella oxytoca TaxID=571 RepID=UPI001B8190D5|nr:hypothetical protein [Klebsiella oxytoca]MBR7596909.1 hypothetical protein [Klebsiella oxytoca]
MSRQRPLPAAARKAVRQIATAFVCAEVEAQVVAKLFEEEFGKPYDREAADSYLNSFLHSDPDTRRVWNLMQKDVASVRKDFAERMRRDRDC